MKQNTVVKQSVKETVKIFYNAMVKAYQDYKRNHTDSNRVSFENAQKNYHSILGK